MTITLIINANPNISMKFMQNKNGEAYLSLDDEYDYYRFKAPEGWSIDRYGEGLTNKYNPNAINRRSIPVFAGDRLMAGRTIERSSRDSGVQYTPYKKREIEHLSQHDRERSILEQILRDSEKCRERTRQREYERSR